MKQISRDAKYMIDLRLTSLNAQINETNETIIKAKELGDHSENAELEAATDEFNKLTKQRDEYYKLIEDSEVVYPKDGNLLTIGKIFKYELLDSTSKVEESIILLLDSFTSIDDMGVINISTPVGKLIYNKKPGVFNYKNKDGVNIRFRATIASPVEISNFKNKFIGDI